MKIKIDLNLASKMLLTFIIAGISIYVFMGTGNMAAADAKAQSEKVMQLIDKALVQCYALEGSYPSDSEFKDKMAKYGVILNEDKYNFYYSAFSANLKPDVMVTPIILAEE
jgi:hypothetical protein